MEKEYQDSIEQMKQIEEELKILYRNAQFLYHMLMQQQDNPKDAEIILSSAEVNYFFMVVRFCAFADSYHKEVDKIIPQTEKEEIEKRFSNVDLTNLKRLRDEVLAHNYNKKVTNKKYVSVLSDVLAGKYNSIISTPAEFDFLSSTASSILGIISISESATLSS